MDFSAYPKSNIMYGGSERKESVRISGHEYMLKYRKRDEFGIRNNHLSEYLGSHIFALLGFETQETHLGTYDDQPVVACRSFIGSEELFVPFNDVGESSLEQDKEKYQYEYADIMQMLRDNSKLTSINETITVFWEMFVIDALLGNFDRHGANWGFIKKNNKYRLAPVFDNGSCLYPKLSSEDEMIETINSQELTAQRIYQFPKSQIRLRGKKSLYSEVIASLEFEECNHALVSIMERIDLSAIFDLVHDMEYASDIQKAFYQHMLKSRFNAILKEPFEALSGGPR